MPSLVPESMSARLDLAPYRRLLAAVAGQDCELRLDRVPPPPGAERPLHVALKLGRAEAWLVLDAVPAETSDEHLAMLRDLLDAAAALLERESAQDEVLTGLSRELTARSDELNLVYELDERAANSGGESVLDDLVDATRQYLDIDDVVLVVCDEQHLHHAGTKRAPDRLIEQVMQHLTLAPETLLLNRDKAFERPTLDFAADVNLVATPIRLHGDGVSGALMFFNDDERGHFTSADRRLCEVIAAECGKTVKRCRDPVTGLFNRAGVEAAFASVENDGPRAMLLLDIDDFHMVNDRVGAANADRILCQVGERISRLPHADLKRIGRLGADRFAIASTTPDLDALSTQANDLVRCIGELPFDVADISLGLTASCGAVYTGRADIEPALLIAAAEIALEDAKQAGGGATRAQKYGDGRLRQQRQQLDLATRVREAIRGEGFQLFAQEIVALGAGGEEPPYYETLLRLRDEDGDIVSPRVFIPVAERFRLMAQLDQWVLRHAIELLGEWSRAAGGVRLAVNVSGQSIGTPGFAREILGWLHEFGVAPARLCVELTETSAIEDLGSAVEFMHTLRDAGCRIALDDFGTGMSSFGYLRTLPVDMVKIDGAFVSHMMSNELDRTFVEVIHQLAHAMGLLTVAEFVEDAAVCTALSDIGLDYGQGYYFDKPGPLVEKLGLLTHRSAAAARRATAS